MGTPSQRDSATNVCFSVSGKHIRSALSRRHGFVKQNSAMIPEYSKAEGGGVVLDTSFGYVKEESFSIDTLKRWEVYE
ncbi:hypothetical protein YC2023_094670 [Brassica napus]